MISSIAQRKDFRAPFGLLDRFPQLRQTVGFDRQLQCRTNPDPMAVSVISRDLPKLFHSLFPALPIFGPGCFEPDPEIFDPVRN
jgi:hypothetical protein